MRWKRLELGCGFAEVPRTKSVHDNRDSRMKMLKSLAPAVTFCGCVLVMKLLSVSGMATEEASKSLTRFEFNAPQMGVPFRLVFYAPDSQSAEIAAKAAFERVADLNAIMSDYETDSELNELSRTSGQGKAVHVSDDLWTVLQRAQEFAQRSDG